MVLSGPRGDRGAGMSSMLIYLLMAIVLVVRPEGLFPAAKPMTIPINARNTVAALVVAGLLLLPLLSQLSGNIFILNTVHPHRDLCARRRQPQPHDGLWRHDEFGHAPYLGIGGYAVGISAFEGIGSGSSSAGGAGGIGAVRARDRRAQSAHPRRLFHHDTLAFAQMAYYIVSGMSRYGGDERADDLQAQHFRRPDNLSNRVHSIISVRLPVRRPLPDLAHHQFAPSPMVCRLRSNEQRMQAIGFTPTASGWSAS